MRAAVLAVTMALAMGGPSQAAGFLSELTSRLNILPDNAKRLDDLNAAIGSPLERAIARDALASERLVREARIPAPPSPILGPSLCRTGVGACAVNVLATAGQSCWCPTDDGGFATGTVAQ